MNVAAMPNAIRPELQALNPNIQPSHVDGKPAHRPAPPIPAAVAAKTEFVEPKPNSSPWHKDDSTGESTQVAEVKAHYDASGVLVTHEGIRLLQGPGGAFMEDPRDLYELRSSLGKGSYGNVVLAVHKRSGMKAAIKILPFNQDTDAEITAYEKEIRLLQDGGECPFLVHLIETYRFTKEVWIVMEYCEAGSLQSILKNSPTKTFDEDTVSAVIKMLALGLLHMHKMRKIHRDIKADNILVNKAGQVKIADFGLSTILASTNAEARTLCGTPYYVAPELCRRESYTSKADIWSLGMLTYVMLTGSVPAFIQDRKPVAVMDLIMRCSADSFKLPGKPEDQIYDPAYMRDVAALGQHYPDNSGWGKKTLDFLRVTLHPDANRRWSAEELMMHPFIFKVPRSVRRKVGADGKPAAIRSGIVIGQEGSIDFVVLNDPAHGAWPVFSNMRPDARNLGAVLSRDDLGYGASRIFARTIMCVVDRIEGERRQFDDAVLDKFTKRKIGPVLMYTRGHNDEADKQAVLAQRAMNTEPVVNQLARAVGNHK